MNRNQGSGVRGQAVLSLQNIFRTYQQGESRLEILKSLSLHVNAGEVVGLIGPSGCGKTTLLQIAGLLDAPDAGEVRIAGVDATKADDAARTALRLQHIGFVYQLHHLLPEFSALENILLPQMMAGVSRRIATTRAEALLEQMSLGNRAHHRPAELSGGECQRVAIARAMANKPALLLADEPTGNLDPETAEHVFATLLNAARSHGLAALIVTHNHDLAARMDRALHLKDGKII